MDDLIYRKDAIRVLNAKCKKAFNLTCGEEDCACAEYMALRDLPSAQQWISAHNIFPGVNGKYLVTGKHGAVSIVKYEDGRWYGGMSPIAWMPLPEPYREETES